MTMTRGELALLHSLLHKSTSYLEFGAGESTHYAVGIASLLHIDCVESSPEFVEEKVMPDPEVQAAVRSGKLEIHLIDIGITGDWGHPVNDDKKHFWPLYSSAIFSTRNDYDLVLVDGRFRVACTLNTILHTAPECILGFHDFWIREQYRVVLRYLDLLASADTMASFTKKKGINRKQLEVDIRRYEFLHDDKTMVYRITRRLPQVIKEKLRGWLN